MTNKLLIVTPTTGSSDYLHETVDSLQHLPDSVSWSHAMACPGHATEDLQRAYPTTNVVTESSASMYGAINDGANQNSDWSWMAYVNDDDYFLPAMSALAKRTVTSFDSSVPTIVYSRALLVKGDRSPICEFPIMRNANRLLDYYRIECNPLATHGTLINRAAFELLGGFDASFRYAGDMDFFVRALLCGVQFKYLPMLSVAFRIHGDNLTADFEQFSKEEARVRSKLGGTVTALQSKLWRMAFMIQNWRSYLTRLRTTGRFRVNDYLAQLNAQASTNEALGYTHGSL